MKNQPKDTAPKAQPVHRIRHGVISASIWRQDTEKGPLFNVTFQRAYRDKEDWKYSGNFGRKDLLVVGLIAARAYEWIATQSQKRAKQSGESPEPIDVAF